MSDITQITKNTYLSNWEGSFDIEELENLNIKAILCLNTVEKPAYILDRYIEAGIRHKQIFVADDEYENIARYFPEICAFISENIAHAPILIHCTAGISRSPTALAAYLLNTSIQNGSTSEIVLRFIDSHRPIFPNYGFQEQLKKYEIYLKHTN